MTARSTFHSGQTRERPRAQNGPERAYDTNSSMAGRPSLFSKLTSRFSKRQSEITSALALALVLALARSFSSLACRAVFRAVYVFFNGIYASVPRNQNDDQRHRYHHLTKTLDSDSAQVVKTSITNNSLSEDYSHPDDHTRQITKTKEWVRRPFVERGC